MDKNLSELNLHFESLNHSSILPEPTFDKLVAKATKKLKVVTTELFLKYQIFYFDGSTAAE